MLSALQVKEKVVSLGCPGYHVAPDQASSVLFIAIGLLVVVALYPVVSLAAIVA